MSLKSHHSQQINNKSAKKVILLQVQDVVRLNKDFFILDLDFPVIIQQIQIMKEKNEFFINKQRFYSRTKQTTPLDMKVYAMSTLKEKNSTDPDKNYHGFYKFLARMKSDKNRFDQTLVVPIHDMLITNRLIFRGNFESLTLLVYGSLKSIKKHTGPILEIEMASRQRIENIEKLAILEPTEHTSMTQKSVSDSSKGLKKGEFQIILDKIVDKLEMEFPKKIENEKIEIDKNVITGVKKSSRSSSKLFQSTNRSYLFAYLNQNNPEIAENQTIFNQYCKYSNLLQNDYFDLKRLLKHVTKPQNSLQECIKQSIEVLQQRNSNKSVVQQLTQPKILENSGNYFEDLKSVFQTENGLEVEEMEVRTLVKFCIKFEAVYQSYFYSEIEHMETWESKIERENFEMFMSKSNLLKVRKIAFLGLQIIFKREEILVQSSLLPCVYRDTSFLTFLVEYLEILDFFNFSKFGQFKENSIDNQKKDDENVQNGIELISGTIFRYFEVISYTFSHDFWITKFSEIFKNGYKIDLYLDILIAFFDSFKLLGTHIALGSKFTQEITRKFEEMSSQAANSIVENSIKKGDLKHNFVEFVFSELLIPAIYSFKRSKLLNLLSLWIRSGQMVILHQVFIQILKILNLEYLTKNDDGSGKELVKETHMIMLDVLHHLSEFMEFKEYLISINFLENDFQKCFEIYQTLEDYDLMNLLLSIMLNIFTQKHILQDSKPPQEQDLLKNNEKNNLKNSIISISTIKNCAHNIDSLIENYESMRLEYLSKQLEFDFDGSSEPESSKKPSNLELLKKQILRNNHDPLRSILLTSSKILKQLSTTDYLAQILLFSNYTEKVRLTPKPLLSLLPIFLLSIESGLNSESLSHLLELVYNLILKIDGDMFSEGIQPGKSNLGAAGKKKQLTERHKIRRIQNFEKSIFALFSNDDSFDYDREVIEDGLKTVLSISHAQNIEFREKIAQKEEKMDEENIENSSQLEDEMSEKHSYFDHLSNSEDLIRSMFILLGQKISLEASKIKLMRGNFLKSYLLLEQICKQFLQNSSLQAPKSTVFFRSFTVEFNKDLPVQLNLEKRLSSLRDEVIRRKLSSVFKECSSEQLREILMNVRVKMNFSEERAVFEKLGVEEMSHLQNMGSNRFQKKILAITDDKECILQNLASGKEEKVVFKKHIFSENFSPQLDVKTLEIDQTSPPRAINQLRKANFVLRETTPIYKSKKIHEYSSKKFSSHHHSHSSNQNSYGYYSQNSSNKRSANHHHGHNHNFSKPNISHHQAQKNIMKSKNFGSRTPSMHVDQFKVKQQELLTNDHVDEDSTNKKLKTDKLSDQVDDNVITMIPPAPPKPKMVVVKDNHVVKGVESGSGVEENMKMLGKRNGTLEQASTEYDPLSMVNDVKSNSKQSTGSYRMTRSQTKQQVGLKSNAEKYDFLESRSYNPRSSPRSRHSSYNKRGHQSDYRESRDDRARRRDDFRNQNFSPRANQLNTALPPLQNFAQFQPNMTIPKLVPGQIPQLAPPINPLLPPPNFQTLRNLQTIGQLPPHNPALKMNFLPPPLNPNLAPGQTFPPPIGMTMPPIGGPPPINPFIAPHPGMLPPVGKIPPKLPPMAGFNPQIFPKLPPNMQNFPPNLPPLVPPTANIPSQMVPNIALQGQKKVITHNDVSYIKNLLQNKPPN